VTRRAWLWGLVVVVAALGALFAVTLTDGPPAVLWMRWPRLRGVELAVALTPGGVQIDPEYEIESMEIGGVGRVFLRPTRGTGVVFERRPSRWRQVFRRLGVPWAARPERWVYEPDDRSPAAEVAGERWYRLLRRPASALPGEISYMCTPGFPASEAPAHPTGAAIPLSRRPGPR
jgi:hypothetical protein